MNAKYKVSFCDNNYNQEVDEGIAFGEDYGDIVNNICHYYDEDSIGEVTITLFEDYTEKVLPRTILMDYFNISKN